MRRLPKRTRATVRTNSRVLHIISSVSFFFIIRAKVVSELAASQVVACVVGAEDAAVLRPAGATGGVNREAQEGIVVFLLLKIVVIRTLSTLSLSSLGCELIFCVCVCVLVCCRCLVPCNTSKRTPRHPRRGPSAFKGGGGFYTTTDRRTHRPQPPATRATTAAAVAAAESEQPQRAVPHLSGLPPRPSTDKVLTMILVVRGSFSFFVVEFESRECNPLFTF